MSLVVWLPLNGDNKNYGASVLNVTNNEATVDSNGKIGSCYRFNSNTIVLDSVNVGDEFSVCYWVKYVDLSYPRTHVGIKHSNGAYTGSNKGWDIAHGPSGGGSYNFDINDGSNIQRMSFNGSNLTELNVWKHFTLTCSLSNKKARLYINGAFIEEKDISASMGSFKTNRDLTIGNLYGWYLNGYLNDFRVYDTCLSPSEVKEISKALVLHYPLNQPGNKENLFSKSSSLGNLVNATPSWRHDICGFSYTSTSSSFSIRISSLGFNGAGTYTISFYAYANKAGTLNVDICDVGTGVSINLSSKPTYYKGTATVSNYCTPGNYNGFCDFNTSISDGGTVYISHVKVERGNEATPWCPAISDNTARTDLIEYDCSGYNRNGSTTDSTRPILVGGSIRNNYCYQFDGDNDVIISSVKQGDILSDRKFTISAWTYLTQSANYRGVLGPHVGNYKGIVFCQVSSGSNCIYFNIGNGSTWSGFTYSGVSLNEWVYYTMVYNGTGVIVYKNGVKVGENSNVGTLSFCEDYITIGRAYDDSSRYWKGMISDIRVYATALSADDILQEYHNFASIYNDGSLSTYDFLEV